ncbi:MAG: GldG family protein [Verrucomicrobiota bacterium]
MNPPPEPERPASQRVWENRRRKALVGLNTSSALLLAVLLWLMVNYLGSRHYQRVDISASKYYALSEKTENILDGLTNRVDVKVVIQPGGTSEEQNLYEDVRKLIQEYEYASRKIEVEIIDPDRDKGRIEEVRAQYGLTDSNVVIFESGKRLKMLTKHDMGVFKQDRPTVLGGRPELKQFRGEAAFTAAILYVIRPGQPRVYFLSGHGEKDIELFDRSPAAYSHIRRELELDNIVVKKLYLAGEERVPEDCSAMVVAAPTIAISLPEVELIRAYLRDGGRMMFLSDLLAETQLEPVLEEWGVRMGDGFILDLRKTQFKGGVIVTQYGEHPITAKLDGFASIYLRPRAVVPITPVLPENQGPRDRPLFVPLMSNSKAGWWEKDLQEDPPVFTPGEDVPGPVCFAAAIEKGAVALPGKPAVEDDTVEVELETTRLVVVGDSAFGSNLHRSGGSIAFFLNSINWLIDRQQLISIPPKEVRKFKLVIQKPDLDRLFFTVVGGLPGMVALLGFLVWWRRRS